MAWTDEMVEDLKKMWKKGLTTNEIAKNLGVSKNSIVGKVHRLNLTKLTELDNHSCRWPIGDPKDDNFCFCGKKVKSGQTYCEEHSALAYVKPVKK